MQPTGPTRPPSDFPQLLGDLSRVRDRVIKELTLGDPQIDEALQHLVRHPGKFFRPALALTAAYLVAAESPVSEQVVTAGATVELLHLATLYHDDLCDKAVVRRGVPTVNARYGDDAALVLGDYLLTSALGLAASLGPEAIAAGVACAQQICLGQLTELRAAGRLDRSVAGYLTSIAGKTAELTSYSAMLGAIAAGADERRRQAFAAFGHHLGLAFQIWNDLGDLAEPGRPDTEPDAAADSEPDIEPAAEADSEPGTGPGAVPGTGPAAEADTGEVTDADTGSTARSAGRDLGNGVYTLPVLYGLERAADTLRPLLAAPPRADTAAEVAAILRDCGALALAADTANSQLRIAFAQLESVELPYPEGALALRRTLAGLLPEVAEFVAGPAGSRESAKAAT